MPALTFSFKAVLESPSTLAPHPRGCYMVTELIGDNLQNEFDSTAIAPFKEVSAFMTPDVTFPPAVAVSATSPVLLANDSMLPATSWYKVTLYQDGVLDPNTGKPMGGTVVDTVRVQKNLNGVTPVPTMPEFLRNISTSL